MKTKLVVFDWDGTLAKMPVKYSWSLIDKGLGCTPKMRELESLYNKKEIDYLKWCELSVDVYKEFGLTRQKLHEIIDGNLTLHKGALGTINELRSKGIKVGIISGGIYNMYEYASNRFGLNVDYVSFTAKLNFDEKDGKLVGGDYNSYDYEGKLDMFKIYCKKANASMHETLYVGDSHNDIPLFKASNGVAFSSDSDDLKKYAKYIIKGNDLGELLGYVT